MMNSTHQDQQGPVILSAAREACIARENAFARHAGGMPERICLEKHGDASTLLCVIAGVLSTPRVLGRTRFASPGSPGAHLTLRSRQDTRAQALRVACPQHAGRGRFARSG